MAGWKFAPKRLLIQNANATMVLVIVGASFVSVFSLVASRALIGQQSYQARIIEKKEIARDQLEANITASETLMSSYQAFANAPTNMLGGSPSGAGDRDGDNARLVLDALPSKYDFPALTASLEKLLLDRNFAIRSITGTDDEVAQSMTEASPMPQPVEIPFEISVEGNYASVQDLIRVFENSIRPFPITNLSIVGSENNLGLTMTANTYTQREKSLDLQTEVIK